MDVRRSYDSAAQAYADHLSRELEGKPLDRHLLERFAEPLRGRGLVADLGCGPGHIARFLHDRGVSMTGIDLSPKMIEVAKSLNPGIDFRAGDMTALDLPDASLAGIVAFYSIVHFDAAGLAAAFAEMRRVLEPGGLAFVSFHIGDETVHSDELFGVPVSLDFRFHQPDDVVRAMTGCRLKVIERIEREPYDGAEYPSRRCYLLGTAVS